MILGERVRLRPPEDASDHALMVSWRNDPAIKPYFYSDEPVSMESHLKWWAKVSSDPTQRNYIIDATDMEQENIAAKFLGLEQPRPAVKITVPIGMGAIMNIDPVNRTGEYARFKIDPKYQGKGYATDAEMTLMRYAFDCLNLNKIWLEAFEENPALMKLHARTGFVIEGRLRQHIYKQGCYREIVVMGLLAEEFKRKHEPVQEWPEHYNLG